MIRALALAAALSACAGAARADDSVRKILKTETAPNSAPGDATLTVVDGAGKTTEFSVNGATKVMRDGKRTSFDTALIGDLVIRAKFDPKTKKLSILELRSSSKPAAEAGTAKGEAALVDPLKGVLSVKLGPGRTRDYSVGEKTKVLRRAEGKPPVEVDFETIKVGDSVEVDSRDGRSADEIRFGPAR